MKKVLIVEDDATIARIYQGVIRRQGADVSVAVDGEVAIQQLQTNPPDVVVLDLMLPKVSGIDVLKQIRSTPELATIPVVVFTNASMGSLVDEANLAGATKCLIKAQTPPRQLVVELAEFLQPAAACAT